MFCKVEGCDNYCEGRTDQCGTHNALDRSMERKAAKFKIDFEIKIKYKMPKVTDKMAADLRIYYKRKDEHLKEHPNCQIRLIGCTGKATQLHHAAKRGKNLTNKETFMSACGYCHDFVEFQMSAAERREKGFLI